MPSSNPSTATTSRSLHPVRRTWTFAASILFIAGTCLPASETDDRIETAFASSYVYKTYLKDDGIKTVSKDGVVTLTGTVAEESHKSLAQETVAGLPGVTRVDNQLATRAEVAADSSDRWIGRKVKMTLLFHRHVNAGKTSVAVRDGIVTLTGEAISDAQKDLTGSYAKDIDGVKEVKNDLTVTAQPDAAVRTDGQKVDDASVTAQVKTALLNHRSTSAIRTGVETRNGVVTLTGKARNEAEKTLVAKMATDIQGVVNVDNRMTVE